MVGLQFLAQAVQSLAAAVNTGLEANTIVSTTLPLCVCVCVCVCGKHIRTYASHGLVSARTFMQTNVLLTCCTPHPCVYTPTYTCTCAPDSMLSVSFPSSGCCLQGLSCVGGVYRPARPFLLCPVPCPPPKLSSRRGAVFLA